MMVSRRGFTLIELLVVIAIIGILATLVITQLAGAQVRARNSSAKEEIVMIGKAIGVEVTNNVNMQERYLAANATNPTLSANGEDCTAGTCLDGTVPRGYWVNYFNDGSATAKGYNKLMISKTPSVGYVYGYSTDVAAAAAAQENDGAPVASGSYYCIGTNVSTASNVSDSAFFINNGASANSASGSIKPTYNLGKCT